MTLIFVAQSKLIAQWGGDVGLGKNLFLLGFAADLADADHFLGQHPCGADDWKILKSAESEITDSEPIYARLGLKEKRIDPALYPRLRGFGGLFKLRPEAVENHLLVKLALDGLDGSKVKVKPADMAAFLLMNALK